jgi:hypothetical protein
MKRNMQRGESGRRAGWQYANFSGFREQKTESRAAGNQPVTICRFFGSVGGTENTHFQTWRDKAGNAPMLADGRGAVVFPDLLDAQFACASQPGRTRERERSFFT